MDSFIGNFPNPINLDPLTTDVAGRLSVNAVQNLSESQKGQARGNLGAGIFSSLRNKLLNGSFLIWQRGLSQTNSGYGSDDRWINANVGSGKTHSLQNFTLGQTDVPGAPRYFSRTVVASVAGSTNYVLKSQRIEFVDQLAGKLITFTLYAKADSNGKKIGIEFRQNFGTGGSPSNIVGEIGAQSITLTTSWTRYDVVVSLPTVSGKTLGSNNNDFTEVLIWFDAGTTYSTASSAIGQQSGTFDLARVSLVEGDARLETDPFSPRPVQQELALCQRYFQRGTTSGPTNNDGVFSSGAVATGPRTNFYNRMRATPTLTYFDLAGTSSRFSDMAGSVHNQVVTSGSPIAYVSPDGFSPDFGATGSGLNRWSFVWFADAEL